MHIGKELEAQYVEKGHLSCDSDAPQVASARSDSTGGVVKVNCRKTNHRKTRPYCIKLRGPHIFQNPRSHLKILDAIRLTQSKFHTDDP